MIKFGGFRQVIPGYQTCLFIFVQDLSSSHSTLALLYCTSMLSYTWIASTYLYIANHQRLGKIRIGGWKEQGKKENFNYIYFFNFSLIPNQLTNYISRILYKRIYSTHTSPHVSVEIHRKLIQVPKVIIAWWLIAFRN